MEHSPHCRMCACCAVLFTRTRTAAGVWTRSPAPTAPRPWAPHRTKPPRCISSRSFPCAFLWYEHLQHTPPLNVLLAVLFVHSPRELLSIGALFCHQWDLRGPHAAARRGRRAAAGRSGRRRQGVRRAATSVPPRSDDCPHLGGRADPLIRTPPGEC
jgi:hypothetical protein